MIRRLEKKKKRKVGQNTVSVVTSGHVVGNPHTGTYQSNFDVAYLNTIISPRKAKQQRPRSKIKGGIYE